MTAKHPLLRAHHLAIKRLIRETQKRYGIQIHALAIMGNHLHFLIRVPSREAFANSMRFLAGQVALQVGRGRLWLNRCWSRVVRWGRDFLGTRRYIEQNPLKAGVFDEVDAFTIRWGRLEPG